MPLPQFNYTVVVSDAEKAAANTALAAVSGELANWFSQPVINAADPDGTAVKAWYGRGRLTLAQFRVGKAAIDGAGLASVQVLEKHASIPARGEISLDGFLSDKGFRRDGELVRAYATAIADGTDPEQATTATGIAINQFTRLKELINFGTVANGVQVQVAGTYEIKLEGHAEARTGVEFTIAVVRGAVPTPVSGVLRASNNFKGTLRGRGTLSVGNNIRVAVSSVPNSTFKLIKSRVHLERVS
jgi:hypothetical protein